MLDFMFGVRSRSPICRVCAGLPRAAAVMVAMGLSSVARAEGDVANLELWTGAESYRTAWSLYTGTSWSPFGTLQEQGFRLRLVAGQSGFEYRSDAGRAHGLAPFAEALAGYQIKSGATTIKAFAGAWGYADILSRADLLNISDRAQFGPKLVAETWTDLPAGFWLATDANWSSLRNAYWTRVRLAAHLLPALSAGLETGAAGTRENTAVRIGGLLRYDWAAGEISASAGVASNPTANAVDAAYGLRSGVTPYGTLLLLLRF
jgi:hypothetical protein